jgi:hypothetical protein
MPKEAERCDGSRVVILFFSAVSPRPFTYVDRPLDGLKWTSKEASVSQNYVWREANVFTSYGQVLQHRQRDANHVGQALQYTVRIDC